MDRDYIRVVVYCLIIIQIMIAIAIVIPSFWNENKIYDCEVKNGYEMKIYMNELYGLVRNNTFNVIGGE